MYVLFAFDFFIQFPRFQYDKWSNDIQTFPPLQIFNQKTLHFLFFELFLSFIQFLISYNTLVASCSITVNTAIRKFFRLLTFDTNLTWKITCFSFGYSNEVLIACWWHTVWTQWNFSIFSLPLLYLSYIFPSLSLSIIPSFIFLWQRFLYLFLALRFIYHSLFPLFRSTLHISFPSAFHFHPSISLCCSCTEWKSTFEARQERPPTQSGDSIGSPEVLVTTVQLLGSAEVTRDSPRKHGDSIVAPFNLYISQSIPSTIYLTSAGSVPPCFSFLFTFTTPFVVGRMFLYFMSYTRKPGEPLPGTREISRLSWWWLSWWLMVVVNTWSRL